MPESSVENLVFYLSFDQVKPKCLLFVLAAILNFTHQDWPVYVGWPTKTGSPSILLVNSLPLNPGVLEYLLHGAPNLYFLSTKDFLKSQGPVSFTLSF